MHKKEEFMREAIRLSEVSVHEGGGPFGAVIVDPKTQTIVGEGKNRVAIDHDPSAHAEIVAIRDACKKLERTELSGYVLFTSTIPCPGCMAESVFNANIKEIYYGNSAEDTSSIGFADEKNWRVRCSTPREEMERLTKDEGLVIEQLLASEAQTAFTLWQSKPDKEMYYK